MANADTCFRRSLNTRSVSLTTGGSGAGQLELHQGKRGRTPRAVARSLGRLEDLLNMVIKKNRLIFSNVFIFVTFHFPHLVFTVAKALVCDRL